MRKTAILTFSLLFAGATFAQSSLRGTAKEGLKSPDKPAKKVSHDNTESSSAAVIWSEDFANGIPTDWTSTGSSDPDSRWEYRGPNTTPDNTQGSRGAFGGAAPLNSPTASNGFVIFDSDYLDNNGNPATMGQGPAPTPHRGELITDTIDCSGHPFVQITMSSRARNFDSQFLVAISNDGGATYTDTVKMHDIAVNSQSADGAIVGADITSAAGNEANVVLNFIYDGETGPVQGTPGYYYWMFDDVVVSDLPKHELRFTSANGAPPQDFFVGAPDQPKYGNIYMHETRAIGGDANIFNYGSSAQTNVQVNMEIWSVASGSIVQTLSTPSVASVAYGDTVDFNTLTFSNSWTPTVADTGNYLLVYKAISDSIGAGLPGTEATDTFNLNVRSDVYGIDDSQIDNNVGTNSLAQGLVVAAAVQYDFTNGNPDTNAAVVKMSGVDVFFGDDTDPASDVEVQVFDTVGFFGSPQPLYSELYTLNQNMLDQLTTLDFSAGDIVLPTGSYYVKVNFFPPSGSEVEVANSGTWNQPGFATVMQTDAGNYFTGFTGSRSFEAPIIRANLNNKFIGLEEGLEVQNAVTAFPNPTSGEVNIRAGIGGTYNLSIINMIGQEVRSETVEINGSDYITRDFSELDNGVYLLNVTGEGLNETIKLTIK